MQLSLMRTDYDLAQLPVSGPASVGESGANCTGGHASYFTCPGCVETYNRQQPSFATVRWLDVALGHRCAWHLPFVRTVWTQELRACNLDTSGVCDYWSILSKRVTTRFTVRVVTNLPFYLRSIHILIIYNYWTLLLNCTRQCPLTPFEDSRQMLLY